MVPQQVSFVERSFLSQRVPYRRFHCICLYIYIHIKVITVNTPNSCLVISALARVHSDRVGSRTVQGATTDKLCLEIIPPAILKKNSDMEAEWKSATTRHSTQCVTRDGLTMMLILLAIYLKTTIDTIITTTTTITTIHHIQVRRHSFVGTISCLCLWFTDIHRCCGCQK